MAKLPLGFSPVSFLKQVGSLGTIDADVFDDWSVAGGARSPAKGKVVGKTVAPKAQSNPDFREMTLVQDSDSNSNSNNRSGGSGGATSAANALRSRIAGRGADLDAIYAALFGDLDALVRERDAELESQYGSQLDEVAKDYTKSLPLIEQSYAALGAADSTDLRDANIGAKEGFDKTTKTIGENKDKDKKALGQYANEQRAKFTADRDSARRAIASSNETTDEGALRNLANDVDSNISQAGVTRATLGSGGAARQAVSSLTGDNGRYDAAVNALDSILKSSMSGAVKGAAVQAITDAGGLSDTEKQKIKQTYGDVYSEQAAL